MKAIFLPLYLLILSASLNAQTGTVSGNAFWKYNDYVGNKADAGSSVYLFGPDSAVRQTTCDLSGNFKFDNVKPGKYEILILSKNTNSSIIDKVYNLHSFFLNKFFQPNFDNHLFDVAEVNYKQLTNLMDEKVKPSERKTKKKNIEEKKQAFEASLKDISDHIESNSDLFDLIFELKSFSFPKKLYSKALVVNPNETSTVVADFGLTYA